MKKVTLLTLISMAILAMTPPPTNFFAQQLKFPRVANANKSKGRIIAELLKSNGINDADFDLFLRAFKTEKKLEVWAKNKADNTFKLIKEYDFCATTGVLGPKRRSGDKQIPEGFYKVNFFNPQSQYHLSFRIDYPNASDLVFADKLNPGDNIFIHGNCVTIGCIPIGDDNIDELYLLAAKAYSKGEVNVHIFPFKMTELNYETQRNLLPAQSTFWSWLKTGYDVFETNHTLPNVSVDSEGRYIFK